jgi:hypothetical protein
VSDDRQSQVAAAASRIAGLRALPTLVGLTARRSDLAPDGMAGLMAVVEFSQVGRYWNAVGTRKCPSRGA